MLATHPSLTLRRAVLAAGLSALLADASFAAPRTPQGAGQVFQGFDGAGGEDYAAFRRDERAIWGRDSALSATTHFTGTGGPGGHFVWVVHAGETFEFDTTSTVIPNWELTTTQVAVGGLVDVESLFVEPGGVLRIRGPNPFHLRATRNVLVFGRIVANGVDHPSVLTFQTGTPSPGAIGGPGGGRGGSSSLEVVASTATGETGYGAWGVAHGGGRGGEAGYNSSTNVEFRRGSAGGGGRFGSDVRSATTGCPLQTRIGFDAERGGPGALQASGAISGPGQRPVGGLPNASPFADGDPTNDFFGRMITSSGATIVGELSRPWAGAGGGAGGDAIQAAVFPNPSGGHWDEVGGGGGGGGGSVFIQALGSIRLFDTGRIEANGGTGGGGQNTSGFNRIGGAGGGGSGGHVILQANGWIAFQNSPNGPTVVSALGGQGGAGRNGVGGSMPGGIPTTAAVDSINLVPPYDPGCLVPAPTNVDVIGSGGDGGPGVIQLHARDAAHLPICTDAFVRPPPVGIVDPSDPTTWDRLTVPYGPKSSSRSQWIAVAGSGPIDVRFDGTDANGYVRTNGNGENARVLRLGAIASGALASAPNAPFVDVDGRTLVIDAASLTSAMWAQAPALLVDAELVLASTGGGARFDVESAIAAGGTVRLTVAGAGTPLAPFGTGSTFTLHPRTFRVATDGVRDSLPTTASIRITFQGAPDDGTGAPDAAFLSAWSPDANALESVGALAFVRFEVEFDMAATPLDLVADAPRPSLEFLRIPWLR